MTQTERTWRHKAEDIIAAHCKASYIACNQKPDGKMRRRHVPYSVPEIAKALVAALGRDDEHEAKRLFQVERMGSWTLI